MTWKRKLEKLEAEERWIEAIRFIKQVVSENQNDFEVYIRAIYLFHHVILEENCVDKEMENIGDLIRSYFVISSSAFSENAEWLFFIGKLIHVAEWYFGLNEANKPLDIQIGTLMQKKAFELNNNILFEWAYRFSIGDVTNANNLAEKVLADESRIRWLNSKGFPGRYVLESVKSSLK